MRCCRFPKQPTAADVVNFTDAETLHRILRIYGEETNSRPISRAIEDYRSRHGLIQTTKQLAAVIALAFDEE